jgi:CheY-like chemotaxis protein
MHSSLSSSEILRNRSEIRESILVVDDNDEDKYFLVWALKTLDLSYPIQVVSSGEEAISYLAAKPPFEDRTRFPIPHLVLLDLRMPGIDGFEVLKWLNTQRALDGLNVVVFSGSSQPSDVARAKELGVKDYIVKPIDTLDLVQAMREVTFKWLS